MTSPSPTQGSPPGVGAAARPRSCQHCVPRYDGVGGRLSSNPGRAGCPHCGRPQSHKQQYSGGRRSNVPSTSATPQTHHDWQAAGRQLPPPSPLLAYASPKLAHTRSSAITGKAGQWRQQHCLASTAGHGGLEILGAHVARIKTPAPKTAAQEEPTQPPYACTHARVHGCRLATEPRPSSVDGTCKATQQHGAAHEPGAAGVRTRPRATCRVCFRSSTTTTRGVGCTHQPVSKENSRKQLLLARRGTRARMAGGQRPQLYVLDKSLPGDTSGSLCSLQPKAGIYWEHSRTQRQPRRPRAAAAYVLSNK